MGRNTIYTIFDLIEITSDNECWNFKGHKTKNGYIQISFKGKRIGAHRLFFELTKGHIPEGLWVLHKCDNRRCCNPNHLFLGTPFDNAMDMINKNRHAKIKGEERYNSVLTEELVKYIKYNKSSSPNLEKLIGIKASTIRAVRNGYNWSHVKN